MFKNYLIVEDIVQDSSVFESYYYGQFPDDTQIVVKLSFGGVKFAFGDSQNLNLTEF